MGKIKSFDQFINESGEAELLAAARTMASNLLRGVSITGGSPSSGSSSSNQMVTIGSPSPSPSPTPSLTSTVPLSAVPGNDDFTLYMQHQQGIAGAKGLIQASQGTGKLASDTIKTKSGKKYANLVMNIPSDRPQVKSDLIKALDAGDQKTAALLFLGMWKDKWNRKAKQAETDINSPKNAAVKEAIAKYSQKYGVPYNFAITVANIESSFNPASGNNRYKGIFALSQEEFNRYVPGGNIHGVDDNVNAGIQCLRNNIKEFKRYLGPTLATLNLGTWTNNIA